MADNVTIKDGGGSDVTMRSTNTSGIIQVPMSIPTNTAGNAAAFGSGANGATVPRVALATDSPGVVNAFTASATFTPANTSHTANDCVGAAAQFTFSPAPTSGSVIMITDAEMEIDGGTAEASAFRLYLYNVTPPSATADDGAWDLVSGDRTAFLGYIDLGTPVDLGSTCWVETHGINKMVKLSGTTVFAYMVNLTTVTTAAVAHIAKLYGTPV